MLIRNFTRWRGLTVLGVIAIIMVMMTGSVYAAASTIVTPSAPMGWSPQNVRNDGTVAITNTQARDGDGSLEFTQLTQDDKADFEVYWDPNSFPDRTLANISAFSFEWYRASGGTAPGHFVPAIRLVYRNTVTGEAGLLIWEDVYNGGTSGVLVPVDQWVSEDIFDDNFWMRAYGAPSVTIDDYNVSLAEWLANADEEGPSIDDDSDSDVPHDLSANIAIVGISVGIGSGWNGTFDGFVDNVILSFGADTVDANFEPDPTCAGTLDCYVDAASGSDANSGLIGDPLATIQEGIDRVAAGGTVHVAAGNYPESLDIDKALTLDGAGQSDVTIDASSFNDYSIEVSASDVILQGFTLTGNPAGSAAYGIKIAGPSPTRISNITVQNVTVNNSRRTGVDLNGVDGALTHRGRDRQ
ncbi:MAG: hypothetical protein RLP44_19475 [Aggregatilineales bacterium]